MKHKAKKMPLTSIDKNKIGLSWHNQAITVVSSVFKSSAENEFYQMRRCNDDFDCKFGAECRNNFCQCMTTCSNFFLAGSKW